MEHVARAGGVQRLHFKGGMVMALPGLPPVHAGGALGHHGVARTGCAGHGQRSVHALAGRQYRQPRL
jgi:hypothetical protein